MHELDRRGTNREVVSTYARTDRELAASCAAEALRSHATARGGSLAAPMTYTVRIRK